MLDKEIREGRSRENERRKKKYDDYITDRAHKAALAAVVGGRPPYHLTYARLAKAGMLQGKAWGGCPEQKGSQRN